MMPNNKKILLVDDEEIIRLSFKRELQRFYDVNTASCYEEALGLLNGNRFDLLITDLVMPGQDGLALLKRTKADYPEMSVIIVTGYGEIGTVIETMRAGADDFLLKPFDVEELLLRIDKTFKRQEYFISITLYEKIFRAAADPIALVDKDGVYLEANQAYLNAYNRSREELIGSSMSQVIDPLLFETKVMPRLDHCFSGNSAQHLDLLRLDNHELRSMVISYWPISKEGAKTATAAAITLTDVTNIFQDNIVLQQSEERLRLVHSVSDNGFTDCDLAKGQIFYCNNWHKLLGYAPGALQQKCNNWQDLLYPDDKPMAVKALQDCLEGSAETFDNEVRLQRADGCWRWYRCRGKVVERGKNGAPLRLIGLLNDITDSREMQLDILRSKEQLEQNVAQLTTDLARQNEELSQAKAAMKALLNRRQQDREDVEERLSENVIKLIEPLVKRLQRTRLDDDQTQLLKEIEDNLRDITSSFVTRLTSEFIGLTPMEIQVATYVKQGKATKEIADILCLAPDTVNVHRKKVRKKLGLSNKSVNLRTFLASLSED